MCTILSDIHNLIAVCPIQSLYRKTSCNMCKRNVNLGKLLHRAACASYRNIWNPQSRLRSTPLTYKSCCPFDWGTSEKSGARWKACLGEWWALWSAKRYLHTWEVGSPHKMKCSSMAEKKSLAVAVRRWLHLKQNNEGSMTQRGKLTRWFATGGRGAWSGTANDFLKQL